MDFTERADWLDSKTGDLSGHEVTVLVAALRQAADLERWKAEAMVVLTEWDACYDILEAAGHGAPIGRSKARHVAYYLKLSVNLGGDEMTAPETQTRPRRHKHEFHALWWHFGKYGRQDVHVHSCTTLDDCNRVLIGEGRTCGGPGTSHHREWL